MMEQYRGQRMNAKDVGISPQNGHRSVRNGHDPRGVSKASSRSNAKMRQRMPLDILKNPKPTVIEQPNIARRASQEEPKRIQTQAPRPRQDPNKNIRQVSSKSANNKSNTSITVNRNNGIRQAYRHQLDTRYTGCYIRAQSVFDNFIMPVFPFFNK